MCGVQYSLSLFIIPHVSRAADSFIHLPLRTAPSSSSLQKFTQLVLCLALLLLIDRLPVYMERENCATTQR
jgi:hypothetical protein